MKTIKKLEDSDSTRFSQRRYHKRKFTSKELSILSKRFSKDIMEPFLPMDKQAQERHILWWGKKRINKVLFQECFRIVDQSSVTKSKKVFFFKLLILKSIMIVFLICSLMIGKNLIYECTKRKEFSLKI